MSEASPLTAQRASKTQIWARELASMMEAKVQTW